MQTLPSLLIGFLALYAAGCCRGKCVCGSEPPRHKYTQLQAWYKIQPFASNVWNISLTYPGSLGRVRVGPLEPLKVEGGPGLYSSETRTLDRLGTGFKQVKTLTEEAEHCSFWSFESFRPSMFVQACPLLFAHGIWKVGPMRMCWDCAKVPDQDGPGGNQRTHKKLYVAWHCTMEPENGLEFGGVPKVVTT